MSYGLYDKRKNGSIPGKEYKIFPSIKCSDALSGLPSLCIMRALTVEAKWSVHAADHSLPCSSNDNFTFLPEPV
jgi:hypothetical protein